MHMQILHDADAIISNKHVCREKNAIGSLWFHETAKMQYNDHLIASYILGM